MDTLRDLVKADVFTWKKEHQDAFNALSSGMVLVHVCFPGMDAVVARYEATTVALESPS